MKPNKVIKLSPMGNVHIFYRRIISASVSIAFVFTNLFVVPSSRAAGSLPHFVGNCFPNDLSAIHIPEQFGKVQEVFTGTENKVVVLIQDAHGIPDAQTSIHKLIDYFQKQNGLNLIALEGASSDLDPQIFKSFPDKELLKKIFQEYAEKGELTGSAASALFNENDSIYRGIEDWSLYQSGLSFYLAAMKAEPRLLEKFSALEKNFQTQKQTVYSKELLEVDKAFQEFRENHADILRVLKTLAKFQRPEKGTELALLLEEAERSEENQSSVEIEVKNIARKIEAYLKSQPPSEKINKALRDFSEKSQEFQTSRLSAQAFTLFLKELTLQDSLPIKVSNGLAHLMKNQKRMRDIEGTRFLQDFEHYVDSVKQSLFKNEEEKALDQESHRIEILGRLIRLELSREDWNETKNFIQDLSSKLPAGFLKSHILFYDNAEKRDEAFANRLLPLMQENKTDSALLVAGGFHTEGLTRRLKDKNISYLLLMPQIGSIPEENYYQDHMKGDVSWKNYFKVEDGKVNVYKAFVRGTRDKLLKQSKEESGKLLKSWRDQIIRDLAEKEKVITAGKYTQFIDETTKTENPNDALNEKLLKVDKFIESLQRLESRGQLNEQNVLKLLQPSALPDWATSLELAPADATGIYGEGVSTLAIVSAEKILTESPQSDTRLRSETRVDFNQRFDLIKDRKEILEYFAIQGKYYKQMLELMIADQLAEFEKTSEKFPSEQIRNSEAQRRAADILENEYTVLSTANDPMLFIVKTPTIGDTFRILGKLTFASARDMQELYWQTKPSFKARHVIAKGEKPIDEGFNSAALQLNANDMFILDIVVHPETQGKGIGTQLQNQALSQLKDAGVKVVRGTTLKGSTLTNETKIGHRVYLGKEMDGWVPGTKTNSYAIVLDKALVSQIDHRSEMRTEQEERYFMELTATILDLDTNVIQDRTGKVVEINGALIPPGSQGIVLNVQDVQKLFADVTDPWMSRMGRYIITRMASGEINVILTGNPKDTNYAAGDSWNSGRRGAHSIKILLHPDYTQNLMDKNGVRATLIHEAMHARINDYLLKWLASQGLNSSWHRKLDTATEEYMARIADQRALGYSGKYAKFRAWFSTLIQAGAFVNPWTPLKKSWTKELKKAGIDLPLTGPRSEMRTPSRPDDFGKGEYQEFIIGGFGQVPDPKDRSRLTQLRRIETQVIPIEMQGRKILNRFALPNLTLRIVPMIENNDWAKPSREKIGAVVAQVRFLLQVWLDNKWHDLDDVTLEEGIPVIIKRGIMPKSLNEDFSNKEIDLEGKVGTPIKDDDFQRHLESEGEWRTVIFWTTSEGIQNTVYLPRQALDRPMSRGAERTEGRLTYNMLTKDYIPDYLQTGHVEIEIIEHPEYGTAVKFADQGSSNQTIAEVNKVLTQGKHPTPPGGYDVHGEVSEVLESMTNVSQIGSLRREKEFNLVLGGQVEFDYEGPFHVGAVSRKREMAAADFHVQKEQTLHVLHQGDKEWQPVANNNYLAQGGVPVAGHSVLHFEASIVEYGAYTVSYNSKTKKIKIVNQSASSVRITFQPTFGNRSEMRQAIENLAEAIENPDQNGLVTENGIKIAISIGFENLRTALKAAIKARSETRLQQVSTISDKVWHDASEALINTLRLPADAKAPEIAGTIALVLPNEIGASFTKNFLAALEAVNINTVAIVGKVPQDVSKGLKDRGQNIRPIKNLSRPITVDGQAAVPTGVLDNQVATEINEMFVPFWIDMGDVNDPLVRDFAEQLQIVALAHTARLLATRPELLKDRVGLRAELLKSLSLFAGFDSIITAGQNFGQNGFAISATIAKTFLEARFEQRVKQAA